MTNEPATDKQIKFANTLSIDNPSQFSKTALKELISAKLLARDGKAPEEAPIPVEKPFAQIDKDRLIVRQCCIKAACDYCKSDVVNESLIIKVAEKFENWVFR